jgi:hypothetical protein
LPLTFASVSLPLATPDLQAWIDTHLPLDVTRFYDGWNYAGSDTADLPVPGFRAPPRVKLGTLTWPCAATRPAWFFAVVNGAKLDEIRAAVGEYNTPQDLVLGDGRDGHEVTASMYLLPPLPLSQFGGDSDAWLLALADVRFYWQWKQGSLTDPNGTWPSLFAALGTLLDATVTADDVDAAYATPTDKWVRYYQPVPALLDAAAAAVGMRAVVGLDGAVAVRTWENALADATDLYDAATRAAGGAVALPDVRRFVPFSVRVAFRQTVSAVLQPDPYVLTCDLAPLEISEYAGASGVPGFAGLVYADLAYNEVNGSQCTALAEAAAEDFYGWQLRDVHAAFPGVEPWAPTGWEDEVEWVYGLDAAGDPFGETRVRRGPFDAMAAGSYLRDEATASSPPPPPPPPPGALSCAGVFAGRTEAECLTATVYAGTGTCADAVPAQGPFPMAWDATDPPGPGWTSGPVVAITGIGAGTLVAWKNPSGTLPPILLLLNIDGTEYPLYYDYCSGGTLYYKGGAELCAASGSGPVETCADNTFVVALSCGPCPDTSVYTNCCPTTPLARQWWACITVTDLYTLNTIGMGPDYHDCPLPFPSGGIIVPVTYSAAGVTPNGFSYSRPGWTFSQGPYPPLRATGDPGTPWEFIPGVWGEMHGLIWCLGTYDLGTRWVLQASVTNCLFGGPTYPGAATSPDPYAAGCNPPAANATWDIVPWRVTLYETFEEAAAGCPSAGGGSSGGGGSPPPPPAGGCCDGVLGLGGPADGQPFFYTAVFPTLTTGPFGTWNAPTQSASGFFVATGGGYYWVFVQCLSGVGNVSLYLNRFPADVTNPADIDPPDLAATAVSNTCGYGCAGFTFSDSTVATALGFASDGFSFGNSPTGIETCPPVPPPPPACNATCADGVAYPRTVPFTVGPLTIAPGGECWVKFVPDRSGNVQFANSGDTIDYDLYLTTCSGFMTSGTFLTGFPINIFFSAGDVAIFRLKLAGAGTSMNIGVSYV